MVTKMIYKANTMTDICKALDITKGSDKNLRPDIRYLKASLDVPEHRENLINLGFNPSKPRLREKIPYPAVFYIMESVFRQNLNK